MGYALFSQRKLVLTAQLDNYQLQLSQRDNEQYAIACDQAALKQQLSTLGAAQAGELADLYEILADSNSEERESINYLIKAKQEQFKQETDDINREIYVVSQKEARINLEKKELETRVTKITKELETIEKAEQDGIDRSTPKFTGLG